MIESKDDMDKFLKENNLIIKNGIITRGGERMLEYRFIIEDVESDYDLDILFKNITFDVEKSLKKLDGEGYKAKLIIENSKGEDVTDIAMKNGIDRDIEFVRGLDDIYKDFSINFDLREEDDKPFLFDKLLDYYEKNMFLFESFAEISKDFKGDRTYIDGKISVLKKKIDIAMEEEHGYLDDLSLDELDAEIDAIMAEIEDL